jgi:hypothetical protein
MIKKDNRISIKLNNVPLINLRMEFNSLLGLFRNKSFRHQFKREATPIRTHNLTFFGRANSLLTHALREAIVGLESAVCGAVFLECLEAGTLDDAAREAVKNPFSIKKYRGTVACVYIGLPEMVNEQFTLKSMNKSLWEQLKYFYKEIRNPIFHSYEIETDDPEPVWQALELIWQVYKWLNSWHPIEKLLDGPINYSSDTIRLITEIPDINDTYVEQIVIDNNLKQNIVEKYLKTYSNRIKPLKIEDISGLSVPGSDFIDINMVDDSKKPIKLIMTYMTAIKLLGFLAGAYKDLNWVNLIRKE